MMESIWESLKAEKVSPSRRTNLLDLEELSDEDFLADVVSPHGVYVQYSYFPTVFLHYP